MKKLFLCIVYLCYCHFANAQLIIPQRPVCTIDSAGKISAFKVFVDAISPLSETENQPYELSNATNISVGNRIYTVSTARFSNSGDGDPGFHVINISSEGSNCLTLRQWEGWTSFDDTQNTYGKSLRKYSDNNNFISRRLGDKTYALIFAGWPFESTAPYLLVIVLTENDVKVVYNKPDNITDISSSDSEFRMTLENGTRNATIFFTNGRLYYK